VVSTALCRSVLAVHFSLRWSLRHERDKTRQVLSEAEKGQGNCVRALVFVCVELACLLLRPHTLGYNRGVSYNRPT
jgi:hypothetical protein